MEKAKVIRLAKAMVKDQASKNRLVGFVARYSPEDVENSIELALMDINQKHPPYTDYAIEDCPHRLIILGIATRLLTCDNVLKASNYIDISDTSVVINREKNISLLFKLAEEMEREFTTSLMEYKFSLNVNGAWGK